MSINDIVIKLGDAEVKMVLSRDAKSANDITIAKKDKILNSKDLHIFKKNNVEFISVYNNTVPKEMANVLTAAYKRNSIPVLQRDDFNDFQSKYLKTETSVKEVFYHIKSGDDVQLDELFKLTNDLLNILEFEDDLFSYLNFLNQRDEHVFSHCLNVSLIANVLAKWLSYDDARVKKITVAGLLHDIGKLLVDDNILNKPSRYTEAEFMAMKKHTSFGYNLLREQNISEDIKAAVLMHHEKIDGKGYPLGLEGHEINVFAKIVAICDIYDAMTANRIYRSRIFPFDVIQSFEQSFYGELDTNLLLVFLKNIAYNYVGSKVALSNGEKAEIVFINNQSLARPVVNTANGKALDLLLERNIRVEQIIT